MIKVIFLGDIVSFLGREGVKKILPELRKKYTPDVIIANIENVSHGNGINKKHFRELNNAGIDYFTSGNHIYHRKESIELLNAKNNIIRPANYPHDGPGKGYLQINLGKTSLIVLNLQGQVFMFDHISCPFRTADSMLSQFSSDDTIFVDMHAEATSEKVALMHHLNGRVAAIVGTHTHIQTADEKITAEGTGYITDVGGCYAEESVIGVDAHGVVKRFLTKQPIPFIFPKTGNCLINGVYLELENNRTLKIERINQIIS